ncbi:MAG: aldolase/citrate lyase family protein [Clostridiales bacterium]|nr:aldolase/citrate lyase family protein [Clostridiales bacterium]
MSIEKTIGTFFELGGCSAVECLARTGLDYIIIDTEHNCFSDETVADYIRTAENGNLLPYVRIGDIRRPYVLRMLDIGARALIVPNIRSVREVQELVTYAKFPPVGQRGYCPTRTSGWGADAWAQDVQEYMSACNQRSKLIPQCETKEALESIDQIAALDGVDGIFVGPCDLSISLGIPLQFDSPVLIEAIEKILCACKKYQKESIIFAGAPENGKMWLQKGFDSVAYSLDTGVLIQAYQNLVQEFHKI